MNRPFLGSLALAGLLALPGAATAGPVRYALDLVGTAPEPPAVGQLAAALRASLGAEGWVEAQPADARVTIAWTFQANRFCATLATEWWDAGRGPDRAPRCTAGSTNYIGQPVPPSAQAVTTAVASPLLEDLRAQAAGRWELRLVRPLPDAAAVTVAGRDGGRQVRWDGGVGLLSVAPGSQATVRQGPCSAVVAATAPEVDLQALGTGRRLHPRWSVGGRTVTRVTVADQERFSLQLALDPAGAGEGVVEVPCGGDFTVTLGTPDAEVTPAGWAPAPWSWDVRPKAADGTLAARVRSGGMVDEGGVALPGLGFRPPWWQILWVKLSALAIGVAAVAKAIEQIVKSTRGVAGRGGPAGSGGGGGDGG